MFTTQQKFDLRRLYLDATVEARRRGDRRVGSDHLLLALLADPDSIAAHALGVDLTTARGALAELDRDALASVGIETVVVDPVTTGWRRGRLPLGPSATAVFTGLRGQAKGQRMGIQHVLLLLLSRQRPDPAAELLDALGVDRPEVRRRLADS